MSIDEKRARKLAQVQKHRARAREVEIGECVDPERRESCRLDLHRFARTYFSGRGPGYPDDPDPLLYLPMGSFHLDLCQSIQERVLYGGLAAEVDPRGYGKDTLGCVVAVLWATLYGHAGFAAVAGYEAETSAARINSIKSQLETNPLLQEDFPEVIDCVRHLDRSPHRARSQMFRGEPTGMEWKKHIVFPRIPGSVSSGAIIAPASVRASIRGFNIDGKRPDLVVITDPQTDDTARSTDQTKHILRKINKDFGGLGGRGRKFTCIILATIICHGDVAHQLVDREKNPQWNGVFRRALATPPEREDLWEKYLELRAEGSKGDDQTGRGATAFYLENREEMDRGVTVLWEENYERERMPDGTQKEYSNLQWIYNFIYEFGRDSFQTELQNDPPNKEEEGDDGLGEADITTRLSGFARGIVPDGAMIVTRFIDLGASVCWDCVVATDVEMSRLYVLRYNAYATHLSKAVTMTQGTKEQEGIPAMERRIFDLLTVMAEEEEIGLVADPDGRAVRVDMTLVDGGWLDEVVKDFVRSKGPKYRLAKGLGMKRGQGTWGAAAGAHRRGDNWFAKRLATHEVYSVNTDHWKSFVRERILQGTETHGALLLYGDDPMEHKRFAQHLLAERFNVEKGSW
jgi:hypothetical protein